MIIEKELSDKIINCAFKVHKTLGYGFLEKVYENSLVLELKLSGLEPQAQFNIPVYYRNQIVGDYKADILVNEKIVLELKAENEYNKAHEAQLINYLKASKIKLGYLLNFGRNKLEFKRIIF